VVYESLGLRYVHPYLALRVVAILAKSIAIAIAILGGKSIAILTAILFSKPILQYYSNTFCNTPLSNSPK